jgi:hypothetical protein
MLQTAIEGPFLIISTVVEANPLPANDNGRGAAMRGRGALLGRIRMIQRGARAAFFAGDRQAYRGLLELAWEIEQELD